MRKKSVTLSLPVTLTTKEILERKDSLLQMLDRLDSAKEDAKAGADKHKSIVKGFEAGIVKARGSLRSKTEKRPVVCDEHLDWGKQTVTVFRCDTSDRVHEREMTPKEKQVSLDEKMAAAKKKEAKSHTPATAPTGKE